MARINGTSISQITKNNARLVKLLDKAATQEPKRGGQRWMSGNANNMKKVVTFKTSGRSKGSLERFCEANKIPKKVYTALVAAAKYGAHSSGSSRGLLTFDCTPRNLERLENKLNAIYTKRNKDNNRVLDKKEQASAKKTSNGKAMLAAMKEIKGTKLTGLRRELKYSKQVNYVMDLMYSRGTIRSKDTIDQICRDLPAAQTKAVKAAYASVSRYLSRGRTSAQRYICRDQRREVQRGLMRTFGASLDRTEKAISALKLPREYR